MRYINTCAILTVLALVGCVASIKTNQVPNSIIADITPLMDEQAVKPSESVVEPLKPVESTVTTPKTTTSSVSSTEAPKPTAKVVKIVTKIKEPIKPKPTSPTIPKPTIEIPKKPVVIATTANIKPTNLKEYIPKNVERLGPTVYKEYKKFGPRDMYPWYFYSLIEQESCITLTHSKCWNEKSQLKNSRENGIGLFQLTRAWDKNGKLRFDTLTDLSRKYKDLKELNWNNVLNRPDLQIRAGILLSKENWNKLSPVTDVFERHAMADAAYNGGINHVLKERTACGLLKGCDPQKWFGHVEKITTVKSQKKIAAYGNRSVWTINREHASLVMNTRLSKYQRYVLTHYQ